MEHRFEIYKEGIILKPLGYKDIELLRVLRNKNENRNCFLYSDIISKEQQEAWYQNYLKKTGDYMFSIFKENKLDEFLGAVAIYNFDEEDNSAEFGRIILDKSKINEKGIGSIVTKIFCDFVFKNFSLEEIKLEVFKDNIAALKTYEKVGFEKKHEFKEKGRILVKMSLKNSNI